MKLLTWPNLTLTERELEIEFREPMGMILKGYALMGYGRARVAKDLGVSIRRIAAHDPHGEIPWPSNKRSANA